MADLENHTSAAEVTKSALLRDLRIHECHTIRESEFRLACEAVAFERRLVVIEDNDFRSALLQRGDFRDRRSAAVDRDQKLRLMLQPAALDTFTTEAVPFLHAQWQKQLRCSTVGAQHFIEERKRCDAVHIVIAEKDDAFTMIDRMQDADDRGGHVRQQERIGQRGKAGLKKAAHVFRAAEAFAAENVCDAGQAAELGPWNDAMVLLI